MAIYKEISPREIRSQRSKVNQIVDLIQSDISSSVSTPTRKKFEVFVTGGIGPGVSSSLHQTVYDNDYSLQIANPTFDITFGMYHSSSYVLNTQTGIDLNGKELYPSSSMMMREKTGIYRQFAATLLGDSEAQFISPLDSTTTSDNIDVGLFLCFKRIFTRDEIKKQTLALKMFKGAANTGSAGQPPNLNLTSEREERIYTDVSSSVSSVSIYGGQVGNVYDSSNVNNSVGLVFYDRGIVVLDFEKILSGSEICSGTIDAVNSSGEILLGGSQTFVPDFIVSASIDNILDHVCTTRFSSGSSNAAITFQNTTTINSTLVFCKVDADESNYSSNPTYVDEFGSILVTEEQTDGTFSDPFTYVTTIGLYDAADNLLAVSKLSRPVLKDPTKELTFRIRLDF